MYKIYRVVTVVFIFFGIGFSGLTTAQTGSLSLAQATQETIEGMVTKIEGQRLEVRLVTGNTRWFTTKAPLQPSYIGIKVKGLAVQAGDTGLLLSPVFSR